MIIRGKDQAEEDRSQNNPEDEQSDKNNREEDCV
jgi:hypothetical protein